MRETTSAGQIRLARTIAFAADLLQIVAFPLFLGGGFSFAEDLLDVAIGAVMIALLGWHWAFVPTFIAEVIPVVDLFPSWTAAVLFATRDGARAPARRTVIDITPHKGPPEGASPRDELASRKG